LGAFLKGLSITDGIDIVSQLRYLR
jgi:hypothetical protein